MCSDSMILHLPQKCLASSTLLYTCVCCNDMLSIATGSALLHTSFNHVPNLIISTWLIPHIISTYYISIRTYPESFSLMSLLICRRHHSQSFSGAPLEAARPAVASIHAPRRRTRLPANGWHVGACLHWPRASKVESPFNLQGPIDT